MVFLLLKPSCLERMIPMRRFMPIQLFSIIGLAACLGLGGRMAAADPVKKTPDPAGGAKALTAHLGKVQHDPEHLTINKRTPIPHQPLEPVDLKTGKKVSADTMLDVAGGKKVKAGSYFAELNKLEKKFNELGYSLRHCKNEKVLLQQTRLDEKGLEQQSKTMRAAHLPFAAKTMHAVPDQAGIEKKYASGIKLDANRVKNLGAAAAAAPGAVELPPRQQGARLREPRRQDRGEGVRGQRRRQWRRPRGWLPDEQGDQPDQSQWQHLLADAG